MLRQLRMGEGRSEKAVNYIFMTNRFYIANLFNSSTIIITINYNNYYNNSTKYKDNPQEAIYNLSITK